MFGQMNLWDTRNVTFSPGSVSGVTRYDKQVGPTPVLCGPVLVPASLSVTQAMERGLLTSGTYGPPGSISFNTANIKIYRSWVSRLQARTAMLGSTLYKLTWKEQVTPAGLSFSLLRASVRRISGIGNGSLLNPGLTRLEIQVIADQISGWATPVARDYRSESATEEFNKKRWGHSRGKPLSAQATLSGWPSPTARDHSRGVKLPRPHDTGIPLSQRVAMAGWPTPSCQNTRSGRPEEAIAKNRKDGSKIQIRLQDVAALTGPARLTATGEILTGCSARMESGGQLDPAHPRWLMGLPPEWDDCAPTGTRSTRKPQKK